jgi:hypothetical protein
MKSKSRIGVFAITAIIVSSFATLSAKEGVAMKDGKMMTVKDGEKAEMTEDVTLKDGSKVMTDGSVVSGDGTKWSLKNGEMIDWDGKFSVHFVKDGVVQKDGKVWVIKAGEKSELSGETTLSDGTKVQADGDVVSKNNKEWELSDGDAILQDGRPVTEGSVVGWGEKPLLTDDCAGTPLKEEMKFPNGNKVTAEGAIAFSDGKTGKLQDGDVIQKDGTYLPAGK